MRRALDRISGDPSRPTIIASLEGLGEFDLGLGTPLKLSASEHQACHRVWVTRLNNGRVEPFEWSSLGSTATPAPAGGRQSQAPTEHP
jgi:hypothetical protein